MDKLLVGVLLAGFITSTPHTIEYKAEATQIELKTIWTENELMDIAKDYAEYYKVNVHLTQEIIKCEAPWKQGENGRYYDKNDSQSRIRYNEGQIRRNPSWGNVGDRERSFGVVQIHEPAHPNITREQATDPYFAINFLTENIKKGKASMWTCSNSK